MMQYLQRVTVLMMAQVHHASSTPMDLDVLCGVVRVFSPRGLAGRVG
jgi:hypothetical protein